LNKLPIGIFDSGVGGLTVYRALHDRLPDERFIYLGDTARVPYGTKSLATVERYAIENSQFLASLGIKALVVACNTASALALPAIRKAVGLDVVGVIGPGGRKAVHLTKDHDRPKIGVIATEATVASNAYVEAIRRASATAEVFQSACPLFVPLAEEGWTAETETFSIANKYLGQINAFAPDALVLGCTHYHWIEEEVKAIAAGRAEVLQPEAAIVRQVKRVLHLA